MAKRKRKRRARGRLIVIAIALIVAGFMVRRTLLPQFLHYLAYRPPEPGMPPPATSTPAPPETASRQEPLSPSEPRPASVSTANSAPHEHLTDRDRQELEEVLRRKNR